MILRHRSKFKEVASVINPYAGVYRRDALALTLDPPVQVWLKVTGVGNDIYARTGIQKGFLPYISSRTQTT